MAFQSWSDIESLPRCRPVTEAGSGRGGDYPCLLKLALNSVCKQQRVTEDTRDRVYFRTDVKGNENKINVPEAVRVIFTGIRWMNGTQCGEGWRARRFQAFPSTHEEVPLWIKSRFFFIFFRGGLGPRKPYGLLGTGKWRWGKREIIYLSLHCHHQNDSCIKMGAMRTILMFHWLYCMGQSHKTVSTNHSLFEDKGETKRNRAEIRLLTSLTHYH